MRSKISILNTAVDWQAASLALGVGVGMAAPKGGRDAGGAIGFYAFANEVENLATSTVLRPFVEILHQHPEASHVCVVQNFTAQESVRCPTSGTATLTTPGKGEAVFNSHRWPSVVDSDDWDFISVEDDRIFFTLSRADVDAFTIGEVVCWNALAEIVLQEHKLACEPEQAALHVRSGFSEDRVAKGRAPLKWGAPGLNLIDAYLEHGGNPSAMDTTGSTALAVAIYLQADYVVRKLVAVGADINAPAAGGLYPIDIAVLSGQAAMVRLCGELGALPNTPGYLQPSLRAVDMRSLELLVELLKLGASVDAETADGISLKDYAGKEDAQVRAQFLAAITQFEVASALGSAIDGEARKSSSARVGVGSGRKTTFSL